MLTPSKISKVNCYDRLNYIRDYDGDYASGLTEQLRSSFDASPDYVEVYRNYNFDTKYKTRIFEGNDADKKLGFKYLQSYPYDLPQFRIGDYIHWKYDHIQLSTWLLISLDTQHLYDVKGRMMLCNNYLKWIDENGKLQSYECVFVDSLTYASFKYSETGVIQVNGTIAIYVQQNEDTRKIYRNQRFMFDGIPYTVNNLLRSVNSNFLQLDLIETQRLDADDLVNNIADNGIELQETPKDTQVKINPSIKEILEGATQEFTIDRYVNGKLQKDIYTFEAYGVPTENYEMNILGDNSFSIKNIKEYSKGFLQVLCTNQSTGETSLLELWLVGGW